MGTIEVRGTETVKLPRLSISGSMALVILIAVDFAAIRQTFRMRGTPILVILGVFFMANLVAVCIYQGSRRNSKNKAFLYGFSVSGILSMFGFVGFLWAAPDSVMGSFNRASMPIEKFILSHLGASQSPDSWGTGLHSARVVVLRLAFAALFALPQILFAVVGGWVFSKTAFARRFDPET